MVDPHASNQTRRVLVVDDDVSNLNILRRLLEKCGFVVVTADGVPSAQTQLVALGFEEFDCVVTDYQMGDLTGLDLLAWLKDQSANLATIMLTAMGEKELVANSLRGGAADFLEKPVDIQKLCAAIAKATALTQQQRHACEVQSAVKEMGRMQARMMQRQRAGLPVAINICFHPKLDAGGDYFSHFQPSEDQYCCLLADVSGHDLQAAYLSAYFQGGIRCMLDQGLPLPEVFEYFNRLLLQDWMPQSDAGISVAVCALLLNIKWHTVAVITCGTPAPIYIEPDGRAITLTEQGGPPLGWFEEFALPARQYQADPGGGFLMWTDGLEDLAEKSGLSVFSLAWSLQQARAGLRKLAELELAADDILLAEVLVPADGPHSVWRPLIFNRLHGGQSVDIDDLEAFWSRSLIHALPELASPMLHDILLVTREAVLNSLRHGCANQADQWATLQISYEPQQRQFRIWVDDFGPGHDFDFAAHEEASQTQLLTAHRGLILMKQFSQAMLLERHGAGVRLDLGPEPSPASSCA
jgi:FixJ family two-component response regulator/anti-sigma regulatory factor (Ser/Thr protein kinase)